MFNTTFTNAILCCIVFWSKSRNIFNRSPTSTQENLKPIQSRGNVYNPSNSTCSTCSTKTLRSHGIQESAHLVFFTWSLLHLISEWFSDTLFTSVNALTILGWGGRGSSSDSRTLFRFVLAVQIARTWFNQQIHEPFHYVHLPSRPQNPNNQNST